MVLTTPFYEDVPLYYRTSVTLNQLPVLCKFRSNKTAPSRGETSHLVQLPTLQPYWGVSWLSDAVSHPNILLPSVQFDKN